MYGVVFVRKFIPKVRRLFITMHCATSCSRHVRKYIQYERSICADVRNISSVKIPPYTVQRTPKGTAKSTLYSRAKCIRTVPLMPGGTNVIGWVRYNTGTLQASSTVPDMTIVYQPQLILSALLCCLAMLLVLFVVLVPYHCPDKDHCNVCLFVCLYFICRFSKGKWMPIRGISGGKRTG